MQLDQHLADQLGQCLGPDFPSDLAVAVSGGGDSMALLHLTAGWARRFGVVLRAVTVDHGLRPESSAEAALVADEAAGLGVAHEILNWRGWDGQGNLQQAARDARLTLIADWLGPTRHVLMAHTQDDQAETVLMRLIRGSGVDGLAAMQPMRSLPRTGHMVVRPLLDVPRDALRHYCRTLRIPFVDDPSNDDPRYDRVKLRRLIADSGLSTASLAETARRMSRARAALSAQAVAALEELAASDTIKDNYLAYDRDGFARHTAEIQLRLLADALMRIGQNPYRPRARALDAGLDTLLAGGRMTLHGCTAFATRTQIVVTREVAACGPDVSPTEVWDDRWMVTGPETADLRIAAVGDAGLAQLDWRDCGLHRLVLEASPGVWQADTLVAAPLAGHKNGWTAQIVADFPSTLDAH